jgi:hypothetical protein
VRTSSPPTWLILLAGLIISIPGLHSDAQTGNREPAAASRIIAQVVVYDAVPGQEAALERELTAPISPPDVSSYGIVNDRVLKNIDPIAAQFATYTKFSGQSNANEFLAARLDRVKNFVRRPPESHVVQLESTFTPGLRSDNPTGKEFGYQVVGQIAHLFLGLPDPKYGQDYFNALQQVKTLVQNRSPQGWLGDDLLSSSSPLTVEQLAPYTPRPTVSTTLSINYAEYQSFENAEDAYLNRQQSEDPTLLGLTRVFFASLQVPSRFYIFKVVANR